MPATDTAADSSGLASNQIPAVESVEVEETLITEATHLSPTDSSNTHVLITDQDGQQVLVEEPSCFEREPEERGVSSDSLVERYFDNTQQQVLCATEEHVLVGDGEMLCSNAYQQTCDEVNTSVEEAQALISATGTLT